MLDREGFRPNVGIVLLNARNEVFWGKRLREHSWQFPQGGIKFGETPVQAMYRELHEEVGLKPEHVKVIGRTRDWLRYEVPDRFIRREIRGHYRGQKQIWFLLRMVGRDCDICLRATNHPEFDAWRWNSYWVPLDAVIEFKRDVYHLALTELSRFVRRTQHKGETFASDLDCVEGSDGEHADTVDCAEVTDADIADADVNTLRNVNVRSLDDVMRPASSDAARGACTPFGEGARSSLILPLPHK